MPVFYKLMLFSVALVAAAPSPISSPAFGNEEETSLKNFESFFNITFERNLGKLPLSVKLSEPLWTAPAWHAFRDGINSKIVNGEQYYTPVEKFAKAFQMNSKDLADKISALVGIDRYKGDNVCSDDDDCHDGRRCGIREEGKQGICIYRWLELPWYTVSILEKEPKCPVQERGMIFQPNDIKGLLAAIYDVAEIPEISIGTRCRQIRPEVDKFGAYIDEACNNLSPNVFHVAVANLLNANKPFIADIATSGEVWNQPITGFVVESIKDISVSEALSKYFPNQTDVFAVKNTTLVEVTATISYIKESNESAPGLADQNTRKMTYKYLLELDQKRNIIGGKWVEKSKNRYQTDTSHIDYLWVPAGYPDMATNVAGIYYYKVKELAERSASGFC